MPTDELEVRLAVSATQIGLASRLWSVTLASAVLHSWVPALHAPYLVTSPEHGGSVPLGITDPDAGYAVPRPAHDNSAPVPSHGQAAPAPPTQATQPATATDQTQAETAEVIMAAVGNSLESLHTACASIGPTPLRVLASNTASSLVGAARVLARARPAHAATTWQLARGLLAHPVVATGGAARPAAELPAGVGGPMQGRDEAFLRSGCCLFYRLPGHGLCPDCVIAQRRPGQVTPSH